MAMAALSALCYTRGMGRPRSDLGRTAVALLSGVLIASACTSGDGSASNAETSTTSVEESVSTTSQTSVAETEESSADFAEPPPEPVEVYATDFETPPGDEWSRTETDLTPIGDNTYLGQFGEDLLRLQLEDLPEHDVVTVSFDLFILRSWDGGDWQGDQWRLTADDNRVINTTFSNETPPSNDSPPSDDESPFRQAFPGNLPYGDFPPREGATANNSMGYWFRTEDNPVDTVYRIDRTFLHRGDQLELSMAGRNLQSLDDESWGIDNIEVTVQAQPDRTATTRLDFNIVDGRLQMSGQVPDQATLDLLRRSADTHFGEKNITDFEVSVEPAIPPLWSYSLADLMGTLAPSTDLRLVVDDSTAQLTGAVRTENWREIYVSRIESALGAQITTDVDLGLTLEPDVVNELEAMRLLFPSGGTDLIDDHSAILDRAAELLKANPLAIVQVAGHTDATGAETANKDLGVDRAQAAIDYLIENGVDPDQLVRRSAAANQPEVEEQTEADRATNRRVQLVVPRG